MTEHMKIINKSGVLREMFDGVHDEYIFELVPENYMRMITQMYENSFTVHDKTMNELNDIIQYLFKYDFENWLEFLDKFMEIPDFGNDIQNSTIINIIDTIRSYRNSDICNSGNFFCVGHENNIIMYDFFDFRVLKTEQLIKQVVCVYHGNKHTYWVYILDILGNVSCFHARYGFGKYIYTEYQKIQLISGISRVTEIGKNGYIFCYLKENTLYKNHKLLCRNVVKILDENCEFVTLTTGETKFIGLKHKSGKNARALNINIKNVIRITYNECGNYLVFSLDFTNGTIKETCIELKK